MKALLDSELIFLFSEVVFNGICCCFSFLRFYLSPKTKIEIWGFMCGVDQSLKQLEVKVLSFYRFLVFGLLGFV